jgi:FKBP-type peptidyl-prolyl cis-trans isomerase FkpA
MRIILMFLPAVLLAQAPPAPKPPAAPAAPKPAAAAPKPASAAKLTTDDDKVVYSLGLTIYRSLGQFDLSPAEMDILKQALTDATQNKPALDLTTWGPKIDAFASARAARVTARETEASAAYLTKAAAEPGATKTDSGLIYRELKAGDGASPKATDTVKVNYRGTLTNGTEFDSSYKRNMPAEFPLNGVIKCWTEGVQRMKVGGKSSLVCPSDLAYGDKGRPGIPGGATLIFEVELLQVGGAEPAK